MENLHDPIFLQTVVHASTSSFLIQMLVNAVALLIAALFLEGVQIKSFLTAVIVSIVIAILNATIGEYLTELTGFYQGILSFIVDACVIMLASFVLDGFKVKGFLWAILLAVVLTFINAFLFKVIS